MNVSQVKFKKNTIISEGEPNIVIDGEIITSQHLFKSTELSNSYIDYIPG